MYFIGTYRVDLALAGRTVDGSPFLVSAYAPNKVIIEPIPGGAVGQPVQFVVDANESGKGQLEISVNQGRVPNSVQMQGPGRVLVTFIPEYAGIYVIDVTFNGDLVRGCPIRVEIFDDRSTGVDRTTVTTTTYGRSSPTLGGRPVSPIGRPSGTSGYSYERKEYVSSYTGGGNVSSYTGGGTVGVTPLHVTHHGGHAKPLHYLSSPDDSYKTPSKSFVSSFETTSAGTKSFDVGRGVSTTYDVKRPMESSTYTSEITLKPVQTQNGSTVFDVEKQPPYYPTGRPSHEMALTKVLSSSSKEKVLDQDKDKPFSLRPELHPKDQLVDTKYEYEYRSYSSNAEKYSGKDEITERNKLKYDPSSSTTTVITEYSSGRTPPREKVFEKDEFPRSHYDSRTPTTTTTGGLISKFDTQGSVAGSERFNAREEIVERVPMHPRPDVTSSTSWRSDRNGVRPVEMDYSERGFEKIPIHTLRRDRDTGLKEEKVLTTTGGAVYKLPDRPVDRTEREKYWSRDTTTGAVTVASYGDQTKRKPSPPTTGTVTAVEYYSKTETKGGDVASKQQIFTKRKGSADKLDEDVQGLRRQSEGAMQLVEERSLKRHGDSGSRLNEVPATTKRFEEPPYKRQDVVESRYDEVRTTGPRYETEQGRTTGPRYEIEQGLKRQDVRPTVTKYEPVAIPYEDIRPAKIRYEEEEGLKRQPVTGGRIVSEHVTGGRIVSEGKPVDQPYKMTQVVESKYDTRPTVARYEEERGLKRPDIGGGKVVKDISEARRQSEGAAHLVEEHLLRKQSGGKLIELDASGEMVQKRRGSTSSSGSWISGDEIKQKPGVEYSVPTKTVDKDAKRVVGIIDLKSAKIEGPGVGVVRIKKPTYFDIKPIQCDKDLVKVGITGKIL